MAQMNNLTAATINEANEYFKNLLENSERRTIPSIIARIVEVGAENLFYVTRHYRGLYEDDDCTFVYWDNVKGEFVNDFWGTNFAAPDFSLYEKNIITYYEAEKMGLVNMELVKQYNIKRAYKIIENIKVEVAHKDIIGTTNPLVKVEGGRKWRGMGYFIKKVETTSRFGTKVEAKVLSLEDFQIHYCSYKYVKFVELADIVEEYKKYATQYIDECVKNNTLTRIFDMKDIMWEFSYSDTYMKSIESFIKSKSCNNVSYLIETAFDAEAEERKRKMSASRAENFANIIEWVKTNTDAQTEKEVHNLAIRILFKRY